MTSMPHRLTDVLSRVRFSLDRALMDEGGRDALAAAAIECSGCPQHSACDDWIAVNEEGEDNTPPRFCPIGKLLFPVG